MLPATTRRVAANTAAHVNHRLQREAAARLAHYARHPEQIDARLRELDREWDTERTLEANAALLAFAGTLLGLQTRKRGWFALPLFVTGFLFQHATQGWCPPLPILRRLGVRTASEIENERYALKVLRGDFRERTGNGNAGNGDATVRDDSIGADRLRAALQALAG